MTSPFLVPKYSKEIGRYNIQIKVNIRRGMLGHTGRERNTINQQGHKMKHASIEQRKVTWQKNAGTSMPKLRGEELNKSGLVN